MLNRAREKRAQAQEKAQAQAERRATLLSKAIQSNRVRVDYTEIDDASDATLRSHFDNSMNRLLRQNMGSSVGEPNED